MVAVRNIVGMRNIECLGAKEKYLTSVVRVFSRFLNNVLFNVISLNFYEKKYSSLQKTKTTVTNTKKFTYHIMLN